jgi:hypothetical protein
MPGNFMKKFGKISEKTMISFVKIEENVIKFS